MTTFRRIVCLATAVAGVSFSVSAKTCTWINADASAAQDWKVADNWQDGQVPGDKGVLNVTEGFVPGCLLIVR